MVDGLLHRIARQPLWACLFLTVVMLAGGLPGFTSLFPMDRDEPRFAQASKQMLETGDFVDIRFQGEARNKKPVGIYWLQAGTVALGEAMGLPDARTTIALYRIPSLLGAIAAVLLTYWAALALTTPVGALLAGVLTGSSLILVVEAHLAKTDAVLLATVVAAMGVLARAWMGRADHNPLSLGLCAIFWTAIGTGLLIKGPITPMVPLFAAVALSVRLRSMAWLRALRPGVGAPWVLLLVLPWFVLILLRTHGTFLDDSVGHDMLGKVAGAQESHGAPPGTYLVAFWLTAWPMAPFALLAAPFVWRYRWSDPVLFLLAWLVPCWLLFEAVPTKLPHYVMPLYPAIAILIGLAVERDLQGRRPGLAWVVAFGVTLALLPAALPVALAIAQGRIASTLDASTLVLAALADLVALAGAGLAIRCIGRGLPGSAVLASAVASFALYLFVLGGFMNAGHADLIALSPRLAQAGKAALVPACGVPGFATVGDREPSLVFLTGTDLMMTDGAGAAAFLAGAPCRAAFVAQPAEAAFRAALGARPDVALASRVVGININGGKKLDIGVYVRQDGAP